MNRSAGLCPICRGNKRIQSTDTRRCGYDPVTQTEPCYNCGTQYMFGQPTGKVPLDRLGAPCRHKYVGKTVGRCLTEYTCERCGDRFQIDSGD